MELMCALFRTMFTFQLFNSLISNSSRISIEQSGKILCLLQVHFLYQFSLKFFLDIFQVVLSQNPNLKGITDYSQRLNTITTDMFQVMGVMSSVILGGVSAVI